MSNENFKRYAKLYDALYQQKDYASECNFIEDAVRKFGSNPVHTILDLGCGTGNHALKLANLGYHLHGVDLSASMLEQAERKATQLGLNERVNWTECDISKLELGKEFDLVICMFAVVSYLTSNERLADFFRVVRKHLKPGGLFITDFWYGPAVLRDPPQTSKKQVVLEDGSIAERIARSEHLVDKNVVKVSYHLTTRSDDKIIEDIKEDHFMRYLFLPELEFMAGLTGLKLIHACDFNKIDIPTSINSWTISAVFQG